MFNEIIINAHSFEKRIAIMENNRLVELFAEKKDQQTVVGNVYKGIIRNVLPGMGAAFIDIGLSRTAFLHFKDINPKFIFLDQKVKIGRDSSKIDEILFAGQEVVVQVKKDPIAKKGARVTGKISIPGKFLVFIPESRRTVFSKKISSGAERARIKEILGNEKEKSIGLIVRTEAEGNSKEEFVQEYTGLSKTWKLITKQIEYAKAPTCVFDENDLSYTLIRDLFSSNVDRLVVDDKELRDLIVTRLQDISPDLLERIELYREDSPIFDAYGIEREIEQIHEARLDLPSGGNITIQQTEAFVAVDINTGSFTGKRNYEETIKKTNAEAAIEVSRQIRLRDLSGIMVIDFIDMKKDSDRDDILEILKSNLKRDRAKGKVYPFSALGLVEISRKRTRPSLLLTYSEKCPYCNGTGRLLSRDSVAVRISRWLKRAKYNIQDEPLKIVVHKNVKSYFEKNPKFLKEIDNKLEFVSDNKMEPDSFRIFFLKNNLEITEKYST
ncbi:MAG: Rne/Rng family ribonuclease [Candidatus Cloacimonetes bacterium]|nr:Rne/Rng family ribonuclease [Candidatus Cloacimonadota bacterium]